MRLLAPLLLTLLINLSPAFAEPIITDSTSSVTSDSRTTVVSPPPTAASPSINASNSDLCVIGTSGAVQTQILGVSGADTTIDANCERLKISKTLYDMGMKVAAVSVMCQDPRVFQAMYDAGTPCPFDGQIGPEAKASWEAKPSMKPKTIEGDIKHEKNFTQGIIFKLIGIAIIGSVLQH